MYRYKAFCLILCAALAAVSASALCKAAVPLPNYHKVADGIYRGAAPTKQGLKILKDRKIACIIDLRAYNRSAKSEQKQAKKLGIRWINIPMSKKAPTKQQVRTFLDILAKAPKHPVFVHCQYGADRTGAMIGIYRVQVQKKSFEDAWKEMLRYGFKPGLKELKEAVRSRAIPKPTAATKSKSKKPDVRS